MAARTIVAESYDCGSKTMRETGDEDREASDFQRELEVLREDIAKLASQLGDILATGGDAMWRKARANVDGVMSDVQDKGGEAADAVREIGSNFIEAIDKSLERRPYATLVLASCIGFLFGAMWRR